MAISQIDEVICSCVGERWTKVAMVIARAAEAMGSDLPPGDEGLELIAERIEALVQNGRLSSQGNIKTSRSGGSAKFATPGMTSQGLHAEAHARRLCHKS
jgi:hypothetical protein